MAGLGTEGAGEGVRVADPVDALPRGRVDRNGARVIEDVAVVAVRDDLAGTVGGVRRAAALGAARPRARGHPDAVGADVRACPEGGVGERPALCRAGGGVGRAVVRGLVAVRPRRRRAVAGKATGGVPAEAQRQPPGRSETEAARRARRTA